MTAKFRSEQNRKSLMEAARGHRYILHDSNDYPRPGSTVRVTGKSKQNIQAIFRFVNL
jgi:hypothetical protein